MIDRGTIAIAVVTALASAARLVAQTVPSIPAAQNGSTDWTQLTANGAMIGLVVWMVTKTFPALLDKIEALGNAAAEARAKQQESFDERSEKERAFFAAQIERFWQEHEKNRDKFICKHDARSAGQ